jgi:ATP-dependent RNA helicase RhlE
MASKIDVSRFIKKAKAVETEVKYVPQNQFADFPVNKWLKHNIELRGYPNPMPIQDQAIPHILQGKDLVGIANTGTGKTAAMLIPLIDKVFNKRGERVIIITPTRELAYQIEDEFREFAKGMGIWSVVCVGGMNIGRQITSLRRKPSFVIGTPGRLKDLIERKILDLSGFRNLVLDEVDRMFDMGFYDEIKKLLSFLPKERHSLFFSATISDSIKQLINNFLIDPVTVSVKTGETATNVDQNIVRAGGYNQKIEKLHELLNKAEFSKVLIFGRTKMGVEKLSRSLFERGFKAESIHGDKNQHKRQKALSLFKLDQVDILVATDVAARGLDIPNVSHVINFDVPNTYDDYVHRIGRTGRANKKGQALTFVD